MATLLPRLPSFLAACAFALAAAGVCTHASAAPEKQAKAEAALKAKPKAKAKKPARAAAAAAAGAGAAAAGAGAASVRAYDAVQDDEPDITDTIVTEYQCELNNKVTIYTNESAPDHIALRWKTRVHRLSRVGTTTGAKRFENQYWGLIWIGIPAKGILLDSRLNRQLANECKTAEQSAPATATAPAPEEKKS
jgi:hypothetical protein